MVFDQSSALTHSNNNSTHVSLKRGSTPTVGSSKTRRGGE